MTQPESPRSSILERIPAGTRARRWRWRTIKDGLARHGVSVGGVGVIVAIVLIFFYLLYVVMPMLAPGEAAPVADYPVPAAEGPVASLAMEEQAEIAVRYSRDGQVTFFRTATGEVLATHRLPLPEGTTITAVAVARPDSHAVAYGLSDGRALVVRDRYRVSYPNDQRLITPELEYPLGEAPVVVDPRGQPLTALGMELDEESTLVGATADGRLMLTNIRREESFLGDQVEVVETHAELPSQIDKPRFVLINPQQWVLHVADSSGRLVHYDISDKEAPRIIEEVRLLGDREGASLTALRFLTGGISLLVGASDGSISQWFAVRDGEGQERLRRIRGFHEQNAPITDIASEYARKGFLAADADGNLAIYHATAHNLIVKERVGEGRKAAIAIAPRGNAWLAEDESGRLHFWQVDNEYPEVSWSSLWGKVWYESYDKPAYIWQSSSASNDFEPKFSLTPLAFGTLKAAFYAMLIAAPLAILGAIYTAYFMAPRMRGMVKPTIEIMEALPTVILGFLAGLWLAPLVEAYLPGIFALLLVMPVGVLLVSFLWTRLPETVRHRVPDGWEALLLVPVLLAIGWLSFALSHPIENLLFDGDMRLWLTHTMGIDFDQRNALVVGLAMGFAVIPTIFSIAEDAIFNVPRQLTTGSLALGATPWQTLVRVVILTASPGIFSAVMIGLGRAVGETMIVLMATGNTPVMDWSIFQGMRTLSANIAVEMPESEVGSTHYRVLFLAALVLFLFTFVFNTLAELIRQRLRRKYASL